MQQFTPLKTVPHTLWIRTAVLLAMAIYLAFLMLSGTIHNYMNIQFQWLVAVASGLFFLIGGWSLLSIWRGTENVHTLDDDLNISHLGHHHASVSWTSIGIVALPLLFALLVPSRPLGASAVQGLSFRSVGVGSAASASLAPENRNILDWLREFNRVENPASFNGQTARLVGFVYREPFMTPDQFMLMRFTISCCVADAFAIGIPIEMSGAAQYQDGDWVEAEGVFEAAMFRDKTMPILRPVSVISTDTPASPYLYP